MNEAQKIDFFLPGPTWIRPDVLDAMTLAPIGHRSAAYKDLHHSVATDLPKIFRTERDVVLLSGSGSLAMEAAAVSMVEKRVLNLVCGAFSERWHSICVANGLEADRVEVPWGRSYDLDLVREALRRKPVEAVTMVHNETSTGVLNPIEDVARVIREESDALIMVDTVSSLAGARMEFDAWGLDVVITGSQKALCLPPGLAFAAISERAEAKARTVPNRGFYTDLVKYLEKHRQDGTITTPAIPQIQALRRQLAVLLDEGMEARWERHLRLRARTEEWVAERGLAYASAAGTSSPTVSCLRAPEGLTGPEVVGRLAEAGFTVGGGYGKWKPETFRIGHMGEVRLADLDRLLEALDTVVAAQPAASR